MGELRYTTDYSPHWILCPRERRGENDGDRSFKRDLLWRSNRRCEILGHRIRSERRTWKDRCRKRESCDREIIWRVNRYCERRFCSFVHRFQRKRSCHADRSHFQVDGSMYILSNGENLWSSSSLVKSRSYPMSFQRLRIFAILQTEFTDVDNWYSIEFLQWATRRIVICSVRYERLTSGYGEKYQGLMKYLPRWIRLIFFTLVTECAPLWFGLPLPRTWLGRCPVTLAGRGSVNEARVAVRESSLFRESALSERKNVVVVFVAAALAALFIEGAELVLSAEVCVGAGTIREWDVDEFSCVPWPADDGGASSLRFIRSTVTHSSRRRL